MHRNGQPCAGRAGGRSRSTAAGPRLQARGCARREARCAAQRAPRWAAQGGYCAQQRSSWPRSCTAALPLLGSAAGEHPCGPHLHWLLILGAARLLAARAQEHLAREG